MVTRTDIHVAIHNSICSCGEPVNPRTGEQCTEPYQDAIFGSVILVLLARGVLHNLTVNDEGNCRHLLPCCWICGDGANHCIPDGPDKYWTAPCPTGLTRMEIIEQLDGRGFRE